MCHLNDGAMWHGVKHYWQIMLEQYDGHDLCEAWHAMEKQSPACGPVKIMNGFSIGIVLKLSLTRPSQDFLF